MGLGSCWWPSIGLCSSNRRCCWGKLESLTKLRHSVLERFFFFSNSYYIQNRCEDCVLDCLTLRQSRHHKKKMFNDLIALEGDLLCQKISFSITKRNPSGNFPLSQSIGKHRTWKSIKWNTIKFVFLLQAALGKKRWWTRLFLYFLLFLFKIKRKDIKRQNIIPIRKKGPKTWFESERDRKLFFFFLFTSSPKSPTSTTENHKRKSKKISFIKYLSWNECSWRLISLCQ